MKAFKKYLLFVLMGGLSLIAFNGCYYDNLAEMHPGEAPCDTAGTMSYSLRVAPIMTTRCGSEDNNCHKGDASASGLGLDTYAGVSLSADNTLMAAINQDGTVSDMPKGGGKLDECSIAVIQIWINQSKPL